MSKLGSYIIKDEHKSKILRDLELINLNPKRDIHNFSTRVITDELVDESNVIAKCSVNRFGVLDSNSFYYNDVLISNNGLNYDYTIDELNNMMSGDVMAGYRNYNPNTLYNIEKFIDEPNQESVSVRGALGATYQFKDCPVLFVKYFEATVSKDEVIELEYFVDTKTLDSVNNGIIERTFTIYIYDCNDTIIAEQTTYAGWYKITLPNTITSEYGETYITVRCVDNRGVGSYTQLFDIYVKNFMPDNFYPMTAEDLSFTYNGNSYTIYIDDSTEINAYTNKLALTALFKHVKEDLLDSNGQHYNGIKMYNAGNTEYWLSYYHNINLPRDQVASINDVINLGDTAFYEVTVINSNNVNVIDSITEITETQALNKYKTTNNTFHKLGNITPSFLVGDTTTLSVGTHYYVYSNAEKEKSQVKGTGDNLIFPDYFTVDLNGANIRATKCYRLSGSSLICFQANIDTHLINGKVTGDYQDFDMKHACMFTWGNDRNGAPCEWVQTTVFEGARFCSMENLEISYCTGYAGATDTSRDNFKGEFWGYPLKFDELGTIGQYGENIECPYMCRTSSNSKVEVSPNIGFTSEVNFGLNGGAFNYKDNFEVFLACYDSDNNHIKTIKTRFYVRTRLPENTKYVRASSYLISPKPTNINIRSRRYADNVIYKNCYWHHTRTIAVYPQYGYNMVYYNNKYDRIAIETNAPITKIFGDIEDAHWYTSRLIMRNCTNDISQGGQASFGVNQIHWFEFIGNKGITVSFSGSAVFGALLEHNRMPQFVIKDVGSIYSFPGIILKNNYIREFKINRKGMVEDITKTNPTITLTDCKVVNKSSYPHAKLIRTKNGDEINLIKY